MRAPTAPSLSEKLQIEGGKSTHRGLLLSQATLQFPGHLCFYYLHAPAKQAKHVEAHSKLAKPEMECSYGTGLWPRLALLCLFDDFVQR